MQECQCINCINAAFHGIQEAALVELSIISRRYKLKGMRYYTLGLLIFVFTHSADCFAARYYVIDGDTIRMSKGERIRIIGLDAPETRRAKCEAERRLGYEAKARLMVFLSQGKMKIKRRKRPDRYGRTLARIFINGQDVAGLMIAAGLARPYQGRKRKGWCSVK